MKTPLLAAILSICFLLSSSVNADITADNKIVAEFPCYVTDSLFKSLKKEYDEVPVMYGLTNDMAESTMSLWTNPKTKSWTMVATKGERKLPHLQRLDSVLHIDDNVETIIDAFENGIHGILVAHSR